MIASRLSSLLGRAIDPVLVAVTEYKRVASQSIKISRHDLFEEIETLAADRYLPRRPSSLELNGCRPRDSERSRQFVVRRQNEAVVNDAGSHEVGLVLTDVDAIAQDDHPAAAVRGAESARKGQSIAVVVDREPVVA